MFKEKFKKLAATTSFFVLAAFIVALYNYFFAEHILHMGMLGDERMYYLFARHFDMLFDAAKLQAFYFQRIFPSLLSGATLHLLGISINQNSVTLMFSLYNILLTILIAYFWCLITIELKISIRGRWFGFLALFCQFGFMKFIPFVIINTDIYAYALGIMMFYFYLRNNMVALMILTFIGALTWPTALYAGTLFILFPREWPVPYASQDRASWMGYILLGAIMLWVIRKMGVVKYGISTGIIFQLGVFSSSPNRPLLPFLYLSMALSLLYLGIGLYYLIKSERFYHWRYWLRQMRPVRIIVALATFAGIKMFVARFSLPDQVSLSKYVIENTLASGIIQPANFFVAHVAYFGPIVILIFLFWKTFARHVNDFGPGLTLCMILALFLSLDGESRHMMNFFPLMIPVLIKIIDDLRLESVHYWVLAVLTFLYSKAWMVMTAEHFGPDTMVFPNQYYFMNMGPWMSHPMYAVQGSFVLLTVLALYAMFVFFRFKKEYGPVVKKGTGEKLD